MKERMCEMVYGLRGALALIMSIAMIGSAGADSSSAQSVQADPQKMVADLAAARWDALIKRDFAKAYSYLSPGTRDVTSLDRYKAKTEGGRWKKANVDSVSCEQDRCKVLMAIEYSYRDMPSIETRFEEDWLRQNGEWWIVPRR